VSHKLADGKLATAMVDCHIQQAPLRSSAVIVKHKTVKQIIQTYLYRVTKNIIGETGKVNISTG